MEKMIKSGIKSVMKKVDEKARKIVMLGTTEMIDRDGEVLSADGWELENYKANPVVLFGHDHWTPAVAKADVQQTKDGLVFEITFPEEGAYPLADTLFKLYKGGFMSASSVGFIPKEWVDGNQQAEGKDGERAPRRRYTKQELIELSLVNVPANPEALIAARGFQKAWQANVISAAEWDLLVAAVKRVAAEHKGEEAPDDETPAEKKVKELQMAVDDLTTRLDSIELAANERIDALEAKLAKISNEEGKEADYVQTLLEGYRGEKTPNAEKQPDLISAACEALKPTTEE